MKHKHIALIAGVLTSTVAATAQPITTLENADFDAGVANVASGFDNPGADVPGWRNHTVITDSGVEGPGAWWNPYENFSAFMKGGEAAYTMSDYTIQAGDQFSVSFFAKSWEWTSAGIGEWTVTLFYDNPANAIGSYITPALSDNSTWTAYTSGPIAATVESQGGKLGVLFASSGGDIAQLDEVTINVVPEPSTFSLLALAGLASLLGRRRLVK
ncbi:MAG TPA: PEP-CTERM sorting domain-containing protein [Verrucomicrobiae bacterium]|nr:PEP-CTERM sorting domain-containing protein [Verrucomicrobiae bacterium]